MDFDLSVLGTVLGGAATALLTRFLGITQRMTRLEGQIDAQAAAMTIQGRQIAGLTDENREQAKKLAAQDKVILGQGRLIGDLKRQNREQAGQIEGLTAEVTRKDADNEALAKEMNALRLEVWGGNTKPSGLPSELYGAEPPADVRLPKPPKVPKF